MSENLQSVIKSSAFLYSETGITKSMPTFPPPPAAFVNFWERDQLVIGLLFFLLQQPKTQKQGLLLR